MQDGISGVLVNGPLPVGEIVPTWLDDRRTLADTAMSIDVTTQIFIKCPRETVAAFMFDPRNDAAWTSGVVSCRPLAAGRLHVGSRVERDARFLGRRFNYVYEVTNADEDRFVELRVTTPFPMQIRYELAEDCGGTIAAIRARGEAGRFFRLAGPLLGRMVRRAIERDLSNLRQYLEAGRPQMRR